MKKINLVVIFTLIASMVLAGCGAPKVANISKENSSLKEVADPNAYYYETIDLSAEKGYKFMAKMDDDTMAFASEVADKITLVNKDGSEKVVETGLSGKLQRIGTSGSEAILINMLGEKSNIVYKIGLDGKIISEYKSEAFKELEYGGEKIPAPETILKELNSKIMFIGMEGYSVFDSVSSTVKPATEEYMSAMKIIDGKLYGFIPGEKTVMNCVDLVSGESKEVFTVESDQKEEKYYLQMAKDKDVFLGFSNGNIVEYIDNTGKIVNTISLKEKGDQRFIKNMNVKNIEMVNDNIYIISQEMKEFDPESDEAPFINSILILTKKSGVNPAKKDQKQLKIYTQKNDYVLEMFSEDYMALNPGVNITVVDHKDLSNDEYIKKVNTEILGGEKIDMVSFENLPVSKLADKGFFEDLSSKSENIDEKRANSKILEAIKYNGKIYGLPTKVTFNSMYVDKSYDGEALKAYKASEKTFDDFNTLINAVSEGDKKAFRFKNKEELFEILLANNIADVVNSQTKEINKELVEKIMNAVETVSSEKVMNVNMKKDEYIFNGTKGNIAFEPIRGGNMGEYQYAKVMFDNDYTTVPLPSGNNGISIDANTLGVLSKSENKDIAIDFLKYLSFDEKVQQKLSVFDQSSISSEAILEFAKKAGEYAGMGSLSLPEETKYGTKEVLIKTAYPKEFQGLAAQYEEVKSSTVYYTDVMNLINEEATKMYKGETSKQDFLSTLENKMMLYMNE